jgi:hypothetical protein
VTGDQVDEPGGVLIPFPGRPDPLQPILPNPFGELPLVPARPVPDPGDLPARIGAAFADLAAAAREAFRALCEWARHAWRNLVRLFRVPPVHGWRSPTRSLRRAAGPVTRAVRLERRRRRAQLHRTTKRRRAA